MTRSHEEAVSYQRGYATGRKRAKVDYSRELAAAEREDFRQRAALVALTALLTPGMNWGVTKDGVRKPYRNMTDYSQAAFDFADRMACHTYFTGLILASAIEARQGEDALAASSPDESAVGNAETHND